MGRGWGVGGGGGVTMVGVRKVPVKCHLFGSFCGDYLCTGVYGSE